MNIREISADEALECLAEGSRCYILKELCEVTPVSEMMCARFVVEEAATHEPQPENSSGGGKAEVPVKKRKTLDWGKIQAQKKLMAEAGLVPRNWLVLREDAEELRLVSRASGRSRTIKKAPRWQAEGAEKNISDKL